MHSPHKTNPLIEELLLSNPKRESVGDWQADTLPPYSDASDRGTQARSD